MERIKVKTGWWGDERGWRKGRGITSTRKQEEMGWVLPAGAGRVTPACLKIWACHSLPSSPSCWGWCLSCSYAVTGFPRCPWCGWEAWSHPQGGGWWRARWWWWWCQSAAASRWVPGPNGGWGRTGWHHANLSEDRKKTKPIHCEMSLRNIVQILSACRRGDCVLSPLNHMMNIILGVILWSLKKFSRKDRGKMFTARPRRTRTCRERERETWGGTTGFKLKLVFLKREGAPTMHQMTKEISNLWGKLKMERPRKANTHVSGK